MLGHHDLPSDTATTSIGRIALVAAPSGLILTGCTQPLSTLDPVGPAAQAIATLWWVMLIGSIAIFILVVALLSLAFLRPGAGRDVPLRVWLVWGGLAFPVTTLAALVTYTLVTGEALLADPKSKGLLSVQAHARQWEWEFRYPESGIPGAATRNLLVIPAERPIDVHVIGTDVIHSFWVPRLGGKIDAIPGHVNVLRLEADRPGIYRGVCAEFCGSGHVQMQFAVEAHASGEYEANLARAVAAGFAEKDLP